MLWRKLREGAKFELSSEENESGRPGTVCLRDLQAKIQNGSTMKNSRITFLLSIALILMSLPVAGQAIDTMRTYIFGHSLIHHELQVNPTPSQETSVPHWFHFLAEEANRGYAVSGQYGFINGHATNLPPSAAWGFDSVAFAWDDSQQLFSEANFDNILITPANFIQYQAPYLNYYQDTLSPISATNMVFDWAKQQEDSLVFYVYENWPDMAGFLSNGFPPSQGEWNNYNSYLNGAFHDWFLEYHDSLILAHPNSCVRMIPTGPIISNLLAQSPFDQIAIDTLYEDDAPHGRPTIYFLAALVTYMAMHEEQAPLSYQVPAIIDPIVANNYGTAVSFIWTQLQSFRDSLGNSRVFCPSLILDIGDDQNGNDFPPQLEEIELNVYPNPTTGVLHFECNFDNPRFELLDLQGRRQTLHSQNGNDLDLSGLSNGIYFLRIRNPDTGAHYVRKVWKQD